MIDAKLKPTDLRIGNWVNIAGVPTKVWTLSEDDINDEMGMYLQPIVLSPSILEKCGFVLNGFKEYVLIFKSKYSAVEKELNFSGDYMYLKEYSDTLRNKPTDQITIWNKDIMKQFYLHDLQNLCATLGHELEIKL